MKLEVLRFFSGKDDTLGALFDVTNGRKFLAFTLEDEYRSIKKAGETRIPSGTYKITLRTEGGFHNKYKVKFDFHKGMLWIRDVPGFEYILIHTGNTDEDTAGCLLVGTSVTQIGVGDSAIKRLVDSTSAYKSVYNHVLKALEAKEDVTITYIDYDKKVG